MKLLPFILLLSFIMALICSAQDFPEDPHQALIKHKQAYFGRAEELLKPAGPHETENQGLIDARYYKLDIKINYHPNGIEANVEALFKSLTDGLTTVQLNMENSLNVNSVAGAAVSFIHSSNLLTLILDRTYSLNEDVGVKVYYSGTPSQLDRRSFQFDTMPSGSDMVWTLSEPYGARIWWPCKDTPADKADSVDIIVTVPETQIVGSNGTLVSAIDNNDGTKTYHWHESYPIATYLVSIVAGEYAHFQDNYSYGYNETMPLDYYVFPEQLTTAQTIFPEMQDYLDALSYYFGPYPFLREKYGQASYRWGGAMEHQTLTSIGRVTPDWRYVYVHELGHQWFGDLVTCASWTEIWLNEGFASYSEALYAEWAGYLDYPPGMKSYHAYMATQDYRDDGTIFVQDTTLVSNIFDNIVYDKGSWVLHMLRGMMGDSVFFDVLKSYAHDPRWTYGSVRTSDFQEICEQKSGLDLDNFFNQWLYYPYLPDYQYYWDIEKKSGDQFKVNVDITQLQNTIAYDMLIQLVFTFADGTDTTIVVKNDKFVQKYSFLLNGKPQLLLFDPDQWILRYAEESSIGPYSTEIRVWPNPYSSASPDNLRINVRNGSLQQKVEIYDILGRKLKTLQPTSGKGYASLYFWDGKNRDGNRVSSGVYFIVVRDQYNKTRKMTKSQKFVYLNN